MFALTSCLRMASLTVNGITSISRRVMGAFSVIPAKRGKPTWKIKGVRAEMRAQFPKKLYGQRALVESAVSAVKRKLSARAPGRSFRMQRKQALLLGLAYHRYRF